jgi:quercetin dioxygenase-like cupin family protein
MVTMADPYQAEPYLLDRHTAPAFWLATILWMPMATGIQTANRFALIEQWMPSGLGPPTHRHPRANEGFYVIDGTVAYNADGKTVRAGAGSYIHLPRLLPHSFSVETAEAHVLNFYAPAGFELVVMSCARPADERRRPTIEESAPPNPTEIRILSKLFGQEQVEAMPFCQPSAPPVMVTRPGAWSIGNLTFVRREDVAPLRMYGLEWRILGGAADTDGTYDLIEIVAPDGAAMPKRRLGQDEALYVLEGTIVGVFDDKEFTAKAGSFIYAPQGSILAWAAHGGPARCLCFNMPGGLDQLLLRSAGDERHFAELLKTSGTSILP